MPKNTIIGIKTTHDSAIALIEGDELIYLIETEKINNNERYAEMDSIPDLDGDVIIDGWYKPSKFFEFNNGYGEADSYSRIFSRIEKDGKYSYPHVLGHIMGAYAASPVKDSAIVVVWDGAEVPTAYIVNPNHKYKCNRVRLHARILPFSGMIYGIIGMYYGPYKGIVGGGNNYPPYHTAGKLMSYAGLGKIDQKVFRYIYDIYEEMESEYIKSNNYMHQEHKGEFEHEFMKRIDLNHLSDEDAVANLNYFINQLFVESLFRILPKGIDLIFTGGCALNIKVNSELISYDLFKSVWIPPFCNDSGGAIGQACAHNAFENNIWKLEWNVYCGPDIIDDYEGDHIELSPYDFGKWLSNGDIAIVLEGKSEIGPRALGHRSLMADPRSNDMKEKINVIKKRELFRPVSPICLLDDASKYFNLSCNDEYMLFDHDVNRLGNEFLPAILHEDNTARVQIAKDPFVLSVLEGFRSETGIGILCNTSANDIGKGFFPSVSIAVKWAKDNGVHFVYCNNKLYEV